MPSVRPAAQAKERNVNRTAVQVRAARYLAADLSLYRAGGGGTLGRVIREIGRGIFHFPGDAWKCVYARPPRFGFPCAMILDGRGWGEDTGIRGVD